MSDGPTCWIETWMLAPSRRWRAAVIDTATGNVLFQTRSVPSDVDARMDAAGWVEENARRLVSRPLLPYPRGRRMVRPRGTAL